MLCPEGSIELSPAFTLGTLHKMFRSEADFFRRVLICLLARNEPARAIFDRQNSIIKYGGIKLSPLKKSLL